jgi:hypothetical protein
LLFPLVRNVAFGGERHSASIAVWVQDNASNLARPRAAVPFHRVPTLREIEADLRVQINAIGQALRAELLRVLFSARLRAGWRHRRAVGFAEDALDWPSC